LADLRSTLESTPIKAADTESAIRAFGRGPGLLHSVAGAGLPLFGS